MLLFGKINLNSSQQNASVNYRDRPVFNWFKDIGYRELLLLFIYAVGLTTVIYLTRYQMQQSPSSSGANRAIPLANLEFSGIVNPSKKFKIAATAPAVVKEVYVDIGDRLQPNQPILKLQNLVDRQELTQLQQQRLNTDKEIDRVKQQQETASQKATQFQQQITIINRKIAVIEQLFSAEFRLSMAELSLQLNRQPQDVVQNAKGTYLRAVIRHDRLVKLSSQGAISASEIERSRARVDTAKTNLARAEIGAKLQEIEREQRKQLQLSKQLTLLEQQQQLAATKGQIQLARLQSRQATQRLELLYKQRSLLPKESDIAVSFPVTTTEAGVVVNLPVVVGDRIYAGRSMVELAQLQSLKVQVAVNSRLIETLRLGQRASVQIGKAASVRKFEATVVTIDPIPDKDKTHKVEVQFQNPLGALLVGQTAKVRFIPEDGNW
jgi:multidrug efflux pump subunit AcrA (membrane-fusion protein)